MTHVRLFLSTVSAEFRSYRERLRHLLDRPNVTVKVQEDFIVTGDETLEMLDAYIRECDGVIHLVGDMTGAMAKPPSVVAMRQLYPELAERLRLAEFLQPDGPPLSYTQWEAWLALLHGKPLFIGAPTPDAPRDPDYRLDPAQQGLQHAHLARLEEVARYAGVKFSGKDHLAAEVLRSFVLDLLVEGDQIRPPTRSFTIFVCSTFSDLIEERKGVLDAIRQLKLQHGSMEFFGARADQPIETCLQEVRASDVLVVIVGHRYGSIVPELGISFSEAEYSEGFKLQKPCLVYMRDENVPILLKHIERDPVKVELLERWKETLHSRHTVAAFQDGNSLASQVTTDLARCTSQSKSGTALTLPVPKPLSTVRQKTQSSDRLSPGEEEILLALSNSDGLAENIIVELLKISQTRADVSLRKLRANGYVRMRTTVKQRFNEWVITDLGKEYLVSHNLVA